MYDLKAKFINEHLQEQLVYYEIPLPAVSFLKYLINLPTKQKNAREKESHLCKN